ncbi:MAG TPA: lipopolysaccharide heptosyltransferase II [Candidatus Kryptonia bacterium]|nr:lipopolysaccharide heptosyltransferase II [Candidatus Kryptonia bacterium]
MRIVVAQTAFLGDVVLTTPVFAAVRRHWPEAHITAWVRPEAAGVLAGHPAVDAALLDDKRGRDRGLAGVVRVARRVRAGRFDVALAVHKSLRTAVVLALARVPRRIGFRQSAGAWLYHERATRDPAQHDLDRNLAIVAPLGIDPSRESAQPELSVTPESQARLDTLLRHAGVPVGAPLVGLAPGSVWATKRWTPEGYAAVAVELSRRGYTVVLLGAPNEAAIAADVNRRAGGIAISLAGQTDVATLVAAIDRCRAMVCNDSAPMHIAAARGVPQVAVFGPTHPSMGFAPRGDNAIVVQRDLSCRPCSTHGGVRCPIGTHACMRDLASAEVLAALDRLLARAPQRRTSPA